MKTILICAASLSVSCFAADQATFRAQEIDSKIQIGYGLAIADVNGDKKTDILLADAKQIVWYEAPNWTKHVIAENLTEKDNVCIAAQDIDGDGKAEVAVGAGWNPGDTVNSGALFYLIPPANRTQKWEPVTLHHEPTIHRIKWVKGADGKYGLVSIPLHGRGNKNGEGEGVKHEFYHVPADVKTEWKRTLIDQDMHMTHNFDILNSGIPVGAVTKNVGNDPDDELIIVGKESISLFTSSPKGWSKRPLILAGDQGFAGAGEVRNGWLDGTRFFAAIEPMHGTNVVVYRSSNENGLLKRTVLDSSLVEGHALQCADFLGKGSDQFAVGWRGKLGAPAGSSSAGVKLFIPDKEGKNWTQQMIDDKGMACEDLAVADLNGDGKPDLIAAGRATKNVEIYWNETK
jgi:hypothetical protein